MLRMPSALATFHLLNDAAPAGMPLDEVALQIRLKFFPTPATTTHQQRMFFTYPLFRKLLPPIFLRFLALACETLQVLRPWTRRAVSHVRTRCA
jgi:hypothetical protein